MYFRWINISLKFIIALYVLKCSSVLSSTELEPFSIPNHWEVFPDTSKTEFKYNNCERSCPDDTYVSGITFSRIPDTTVKTFFYDEIKIHCLPINELNKSNEENISVFEISIPRFENIFIVENRECPKGQSVIGLKITRTVSDKPYDHFEIRCAYVENVLTQDQKTQILDPVSVPKTWNTYPRICDDIMYNNGLRECPTGYFLAALVRRREKYDTSYDVYKMICKPYDPYEGYRPVRNFETRYPVGIKVSQKSIQQYLDDQKIPYQLVEDKKHPYGYLGEGANGILYLGKEKTGGQIMAIKYYFQDYYIEKKDEIIIERKDIFKTSGIRFKSYYKGRIEVLPYIKGDTLRDWIVLKKFEEQNELTFIAVDRLSNFLFNLFINKIHYIDLSYLNIMFDIKSLSWIGIDGYLGSDLYCNECDAIENFRSNHLDPKAPLTWKIENCDGSLFDEIVDDLEKNYFSECKKN